MTVGGIDEEVSSFTNMIMFEKEEASIDKEASSSSYTILFEDEEASSSLNTFGCKEERRP